MSRKNIKQQFTSAYHFSYIRLAFNYYIYSEAVADEGELPDGVREKHVSFNPMIGRMMSGELAEDEVEKLRDAVNQSMELVTFYSDSFQIYEYVLNRMEGRFSSGVKDYPSDEDAVDEIMEYIFDSLDASVMNQRIRMVIGELPVYLTKSKFYSIVKDCLFGFVGESRKNLDRILYILRGCSMLLLEKGQAEEFADLDLILTELAHTDFKNLTRENHKDLTDKITYCGEKLVKYGNWYMMLQEMINDLYVIAISKKFAVPVFDEEEKAKAVIRDAQGKIGSGAVSSNEDEITDAMITLEGSQEAWMEEYHRNSQPLSVSLAQEEDGEAKRQCLVKIDRLFSDSPFAELNEEPEDEIAGRDLVERAAERLFAQWGRLFQMCGKPVTRAVMARVLSSLPVFFKSIDEVMEYIKDSMECCTDIKEKGTSMELIRELMVS